MGEYSERSSCGSGLMRVTRAVSLHQDVGGAGCAGCGGFGGARLPPVFAPSAGADAREETEAKLQPPHTCPGPCPHALGTLTLTSEAKAEKAALLTASLSRQRLQQRPGLLEVGGVKAFCEPAVDGR